MKKLFKILFALQLALGVVLPEISLGQVAEATTLAATADFELKLASATYSVKEIPAMIKDLSDMDRAAGAGISDFMAEEIYKRLDAAFTVISVVLLDKNLSQEAKYTKTEELMNAIGEVFATTVRQHGEDKVDKEKLTKRLAEISTMEKAQDILKEFLFDAKNLVVPKYSARAQSLGGAQPIWGPVERLNRNELAERTIVRIQQYGAEVLPHLEGKVKNYAAKTWWDHWLDVTLRLREKRVQAQRATGTFYLGMAVYGLLAPHVDVVGAISGYNDNTLFTSSLMYFSAWATIGTVKLSMASTKMVGMLKNTIAFLEKGTPIPEQRKTLSEKLMAIPVSIARTCKGWFAPKK